MLRSNGRWKPKKKVLALYCVWALILPNCGPRRTSSVAIPQPAVSSSARQPKARNAYRSIKPKDLSEHIRAVYKVSEQNYQSTASAQSHDNPAAEDPELARLSALLAASPDDPAVIRSLADLHFSQERFLDALELYSRLEKKDPRNREVQRALAMVWDAWSNYPKALEHAARAVQPSQMTAADWLFMGRIHLRGANLAAAIAALRKAVELEPVNRAAWVELGDACFHLQDWRGAVDPLIKALQLDPHNAAARRQLALSLAHLRQDEQATSEFMALETAAQAYNDLGLAQVTDRRWEAASRSFAAALTADPSFEEARENLARTEIYRPLVASVTLPSFDLPAAPVWHVELPAPEGRMERAAATSVDPPNVDPSSARPAKQPFVVELEGGQTSLMGIARLSERAQLVLPSPLRVVQPVGNIQAVVQLPEFPTSEANDAGPPPTPIELDMDSRPDSGDSGQIEIAPNSDTLGALSRPAAVDLSTFAPVSEVFLAETRPLGLEPAPSNSVRTGAPFRPSSPSWELRPIPPSFATAVVGVEEDWFGGVSAVILEALGRTAGLALPEALGIAPAANELPSFRPITIGELSVVLGSPPQLVLPPAPATREGLLTAAVSTGTHAAADWVTPNRLSWLGLPDIGSTLSRPRPRLRAVETLPTEAVQAPTHAARMGSKSSPESLDTGRSATVDEPDGDTGQTGRVPDTNRSRWSQYSFPRQFAQMPTYGDVQPGRQSVTAEPVDSATKWKLAFVATIGAGIIGTAAAYFLGLGALATVLIGALAGLVGGVFTLSHAGVEPTQAQFLPPRNRESA